MVQDDTYSLYGESHSAAGTVGNCPTSLGVAPLRLHPCPPQRATGTSRHAPPLSLTTTQRPLECGRETKRGDEYLCGMKVYVPTLTAQDWLCIQRGVLFLL